MLYIHMYVRSLAKYQTSSIRTLVRSQTSDTTSFSPHPKYNIRAHGIAGYLSLARLYRSTKLIMSPVEVSVDEITDLTARAGLKLEEGHAEDYSIMTSEFEKQVASLGDDKQLFPKPDLSKYPRENIHIPEQKDTDGGGWATRVSTGRQEALLAVTDSQARPRSRHPRRGPSFWTV